MEPSKEKNKIKMSWQSYVDDQLISTKVIKNAVIAGHDGNIWASSAGFPVSRNYLQTLKTKKSHKIAKAPPSNIKKESYLTGRKIKGKRLRTKD